MSFNPIVSIADILNLLGLVVGIFTLIIAWRVYRKLMPSELKKRQLDAVLDLLAHLNRYSFNIGKYYFSGVSFDYQKSYSNRNFFNYQNLFEDRKNLKSFEDLNILLLNDSEHPFNLTPFIENPLLPKEIADHLAPFISFVFFQCREEQFKAQDYIIVLKENTDALPNTIYAKELFEPKALALVKHKDFMRSIGELRTAIEKWCNSNQLSDLNFRESDSRKNF